MIGMRRGEVLGLSWRDVDLKAGRVEVRRSLVPIRGDLVFSTPKTDKGRRQVALDPGTVAVLREHRRHQVEARLEWGPAYQDQGLVFPTEDGTPMHPDRLRWAFHRIVKAAGLPSIRIHDLRHTHAFLGLRAGVHPLVMSQRLGHSTVALDVGPLLAAIPALQEEAASMVAGLIFGEQSAL